MFSFNKKESLFMSIIFHPKSIFLKNIFQNREDNWTGFKIQLSLKTYLTGRSARQCFCTVNIFSVDQKMRMSQSSTS